MSRRRMHDEKLNDRIDRGVAFSSPPPVSMHKGRGWIGERFAQLLHALELSGIGQVAGEHNDAPSSVALQQLGELDWSRFGLV